MTDTTTDTTPGQPPEPRPLADLAREMFGDDFHPDTEPPKGTEIEEAAADWAGDRADRAALEAEGDDAAPTERAEAEPAESDAAGDEIRWSTADATLISALEREIPSFRADVAAFEQLRQQIDLNAIAAVDRGKAQAVRVQMAAAERELRQRHADIVAAVGGLQGKVQEHQTGQAKRRLNGEASKLAKALPDFDDVTRKEVLPAYLKRAGFTSDEIKQASDHRLVVLAEKARRFDQMTANTKKVPKFRKGAGKRVDPSQPSPEFLAAVDDVNRFGLSREAAGALMRHRPAPGVKPAPNVAQLEQRLKESGSMDDAFALMMARKQKGAKR